MNLGRRQIIVFSFAALSIVSALYVSGATLNYLRYFSALPEIQNSFRVEKLTMTPTNSSQPALDILINVTNPSQYSGFQLSQVSIVLYFYQLGNANNTLFLPPSNEPNVTVSPNTDLGPNVAKILTLTIPLTPSQTGQLAAFSSNYPNGVIGDINLRIDISTFLKSVTGTLPYLLTQYVPLTVNP